MLAEFDDVRQIEGEGFRRWFTDPDMDLVIWYDSESRREIVGFQLCYDKQTAEHALTWTREVGFQHDRVDAGDVPYGPKQTPHLVVNGRADTGRIRALFEAHGQRVEPELREFILHHLESYAS